MKPKPCEPNPNPCNPAQNPKLENQSKAAQPSPQHLSLSLRSAQPGLLLSPLAVRSLFPPQPDPGPLAARPSLSRVRPTSARSAPRALAPSHCAPPHVRVHQPVTRAPTDTAGPLVSQPSAHAPACARSRPPASGPRSSVARSPARARRLPPSLPGRTHGSGSSPSPGRAPLFRAHRFSSLPVAPLRRARALGPLAGHPEPLLLEAPP